jgi:hypothetical protein
MSDNVQVATPDAGAGAPPPDMGGEGMPALDKLFESGGEYERVRSEHVAKHGTASWEKYISGASEQPSAPADKPKAEPSKLNGKTPPEPHGDGDAEPGEIVINADGRAIEKGTGRFVPREAFLRVKGEAQAVRGKAETLSTENAGLKERLALALDLLNQGEPGSAGKGADEPAPVLNPKEDLIGTVEAILKKLEAAEKAPSKDLQEVKAKLEATEIKEYTLGSARTFQQSHPDFQQALNHAMAVQEAVQVSLGLSAEDAKTQVQAQLKSLIADAKKAGVNWAERVYVIAGKFGYQKPDAEGDGKSEAEKAAEAEIERINNGKNASASLRGAGGGGVGEVMTAEKVVGLPFDEYHTFRRNYVSKHGQSGWDRFIGG